MIWCFIKHEGQLYLYPTGKSGGAVANYIEPLPSEDIFKISS
jgi:hypothetical protein